MDNINTYISVLHGSLRKKLELIKELLELTKEQNRVLSKEEVDVDSFDRIVSQKELKINEVLSIDNGFQSLYDKISGAVKENPGQYRQQILEMQNFIRIITSLGVEIENLEHKNKEKFKTFVASKRNNIKDFKVSNKTAVSYYKNMSNQHREWQSYFVDSRK
ncbi:MAG: hypothetical protein HFH68_06135 [Lachnospiraceae bacterium]|nr:hypothetical protein [Lachnospiraceae bacterium]